jgi:fused signal recognition particle receptor
MKKVKVPAEEEKAGFFSRLKQGLKRQEMVFTGRLDRLIIGKKEINAELLDELEEILFTSDLGVDGINRAN